MLKYSYEMLKILLFAKVNCVLANNDGADAEVWASNAELMLNFAEPGIMLKIDLFIL
ncbi:hypothetical protein GH754_04780 [Salinibacillus xinjiangensis]|uniref:Uncharacterized protein n=1 Tax=Salinibacillus xinjiangensis TaxID=1229268 RepID=A0A6G1X3X3_9BACI|nr:hypothetical protein [Salinibacillus xinjiangensis]